MGLTTEDFLVGQKVLSKDHQQPGIVINNRHWDSNTFTGWFEVEWVRHPGKTRIYHTGSDGVNEWEYPAWPTPVDKFDWEEKTSDYTNRIVFVDNNSAKDALKAAFLTSAVITSDGGVEIDLDSLFTALTDNGWTYSED